MMLFRIADPSRVVPLSLILPLLLGCASLSYEAHTEPLVEYPPVEKLDLAVELRLIFDLKKAAFESGDADRVRVHLGPALIANAEQLSRSLFRAVVVTHKGRTAEPEPNVQAVVIPRLAFGYRSRPELYTLQTELGVEWVVQDAQGEVIWLKILEGEGYSKIRSPFAPLAEKNVQVEVRGALQQIFTRSFDALASSPELQALVSDRNS